jgi:hypothetical protein
MLTEISLHHACSCHEIDAMGCARLGTCFNHPGAAAEPQQPGGIETLISPAGSPRYFRYVQLAHVAANAIPQVLLQMTVGVFGRRLDP